MIQTPVWQCRDGKYVEPVKLFGIKKVELEQPAVVTQKAILKHFHTCAVLGAHGWVFALNHVTGAIRTSLDTRGARGIVCGDPCEHRHRQLHRHHEALKES